VSVGLADYGRAPGGLAPTSCAGADEQRMAVIVPTYRRSEELSRCLGAIASQLRRADQFIVVVREDDEPTHAVLESADPVRSWLTVVRVRAGGVVAALNAGLAVVDADIVAFTDDDAAPRPDWLLRIARRFAVDPTVGGVGGRDWVHHHGRLEEGSRPVVGKIMWFGRCIGHHHLGVGPCREVDTLKGVNMSFRTRALKGVRFDTRLRGTGAQVWNELGVSLAVRRRGWRLVYDPQIAVDHYPASRHDEDQRGTFCFEAVQNAAFNETLLLCEDFPRWRRLVYIVWAFTIGHRAAPGLLQWLRLRVMEPRTATARFRAAWTARVQALRAAR
jgi:GT2 family glycosyltransferase